MTLPAWPSELPKPTRAGHRAQWSDPRLRKSAETGPPGYRRRWSSVARSVSLTVILTRSQKAVFDSFFEQTAGFGTLPFTMPDPTTDGWALLSADGTSILTDTGAPILLAAEWLCLFGAEMPQESLRGLEFQIAFSVAVMP